MQLIATQFQYANWNGSLLDDVQLKDCDFSDAGLAEMKLKRTQWQHCCLQKADLFRTALKGVDLSSCDIADIQLSENAAEIRGLRVSAQQAVALARRLGVIIV